MVTSDGLNLIVGHAMHSVGMAALPDNYYVALSTTIPNDDGTGFTEVSGGGYARSLLGTMTTPVNGVIANSDDVEFLESTASWGTIRAFGIYDSATIGAGTLYMFDEVQPEQPVVSGNQCRFKPGVLQVKLMNKTASA